MDAELRAALKAANKALRAVPTTEQRERMWADIKRRIAEEQEHDAGRDGLPQPALQDTIRSSL